MTESCNPEERKSCKIEIDIKEYLLQLQENIDKEFADLKQEILKLNHHILGNVHVPGLKSEVRLLKHNINRLWWGFSTLIGLIVALIGYLIKTL